MILQMEPAVHVVNTAIYQKLKGVRIWNFARLIKCSSPVRDFVLVSDSSQHEGLGVGDDGLADAGHAQRVTAELVRAKHKTCLVTGNPAAANL